MDDMQYIIRQQLALAIRYQMEALHAPSPQRRAELARQSDDHFEAALLHERLSHPADD